MHTWVSTLSLKTEIDTTYSPFQRTFRKNQKERIAAADYSFYRKMPIYFSEQVRNKVKTDIEPGINSVKISPYYQVELRLKK